MVGAVGKKSAKQQSEKQHETHKGMMPEKSRKKGCQGPTMLSKIRTERFLTSEVECGVSEESPLYRTGRRCSWQEEYSLLKVTG